MRTEFETKVKTPNHDATRVRNTFESIITTSGCGFSVKVKTGWFNTTFTYTVRGTVENVERFKSRIGFKV